MILQYITNMLTVQNLLFIVLGLFIGILFGAIPGLGSQITLVLLLPFSFSMNPLAAILMLLAAYQGCEYGGSISAITLGIPGTPAAAATVLDGYPYTTQGKPGTGIGYSLNASTIGGIFGALVLVFISEPIARVAIKMGPSEYTLVGLIGISAVAAMSAKDLTKSLISGVLGMAAATVGSDIFTGINRFTLGVRHLEGGLSTAVVIIAIFAFPEIYNLVCNKLREHYETKKMTLKTHIPAKDMLAVSKPIAIGSVVGTFIGIFPGLGSATASWFAYTTAQKTSKHPEQFGKGSPEGLSAAESSNNACCGGALVPLLTLGVPGSPAVAIIMGAFIMHGITPGPTVFKTNPNLVYGIFYGFLLTTILMFFMAKVLTKPFIRLVTFPNQYLVPIVLTFILVGLFSTEYSVIDIIIALVIGTAFFFLNKFDFSGPSFILAFVLTPIIEENFRRALVISGGSYSIFVTRPASAVMVAVLAFVILWSVIKALRNKGKTQNEI